jgi:large subunit ribosomal protein L33
MSQDHLAKIKSASGHVIFTRKNKKKVERKLEFKKYDPTVRKHVTFKEVKK